MFTVQTIVRRLPDSILPGIDSRTCYCAVDLSAGTIIPFDTAARAEEVAKELNFDRTGFRLSLCYKWPFYQCTDVAGNPLRQPSLDGPALEVVNILGIDYGVPKPVADELKKLREGLCAVSVKLAEVEKAADEAIRLAAENICQ